MWFLQQRDWFTHRQRLPRNMLACFGSNRFNTLPQQVRENLHPNRDGSATNLRDDRFSAIPAFLIPSKIKELMAFPCQTGRNGFGAYARCVRNIIAFYQAFLHHDMAMV